MIVVLQDGRGYWLIVKDRETLTTRSRAAGAWYGVNLIAIAKCDSKVAIENVPNRRAKAP